MKIRKGMEEEYQEWLGRRRDEGAGNKMTDAVHGIGVSLDKGDSAKAVLSEILGLKTRGFRLVEIIQVALALSVLHERGDEIRFQWNKHFRDEEYAMGMELSDKRLYDPS